MGGEGAAGKGRKARAPRGGTASAAGSCVEEHRPRLQLCLLKGCWDSAALSEKLGCHHPPHRESICGVSALDQCQPGVGHGGLQSQETCRALWPSQGSPPTDGQWGRSGEGEGKSPGIAVRGAPAPAHLLSPRESVVEAGHVSHDGFLIWPQSAYNICAEREKERERQERVKDAGRAAEAGPWAHAGGIALALDWKPNPGSGPGGEVVLNEMDSFFNQA